MSKRVGRLATNDESPRWDREARELCLGSLKVLDFRRRRAPDQELLLAALQETGWTDRLDNPLPGSGRKAHERLRNAVKKLNRKQQHIRFHLDGTGLAITWERIAIEPTSNPHRTQRGS